MLAASPRRSEVGRWAAHSSLTIFFRLDLNRSRSAQLTNKIGKPSSQFGRSRRAAACGLRSSSRRHRPSGSSSRRCLDVELHRRRDVELSSRPAVGKLINIGCAACLLMCDALPTSVRAHSRQRAPVRRRLSHPVSVLLTVRRRVSADPHSPKAHPMYVEILSEQVCLISEIVLRRSMFTQSAKRDSRCVGRGERRRGASALQTPTRQAARSTFWLLPTRLTSR